jgi:ParB family chromosome partitioning protein
MSSLQASKEPGVKKRKKLALGRGLGALIPETGSLGTDETGPPSKNFFDCDVELIQSNRFQPRSHFDTEEMAQLSESIRAQGVLQPRLVRRVEMGY